MSDVAPTPGLGNQFAPKNKPYQEQNSRYSGGRNKSYEDQARQRKALTIASHLQDRGFTSDHVQTMHPSLRAHHAAQAGVPSPSDETWNMVGQLMVHHEEQKQGSQVPGYDPFAGL